MRTNATRREPFRLKDLDYPVPKHALRLGYSLGGITLFTFGILFLSGIVMALFYSTSLSDTRSTLIGFISAPVGMWIRSLHRWSAAGAVFVAILHMTRTVLTGSYRGARQWNWYFGVGLLVVLVTFFFTGTVLRWDQEGYEAYLHTLAGFELLGTLGEGAAAFLSGSLILSRFLVTHTVVLPILFGLLITGHLAFMKINGLSLLPEQGTTGQVMFSTHLRKMLGFSLVFVGLLSLLAVTYPVGVLPGPYDGVELTKPPWVFLWLYAFENFFGLWSLLIVPGLLVGGLLIIPVIDNRNDVPGWLHTTVIWGYLGALALLLALVGLAALTPGQSHVM